MNTREKTHTTPTPEPQQPGEAPWLDAQPQVDPVRRLRLGYVWWLVGWALVLFVTVSCLEPPRYVPDLRVSDKLEHAGAFFAMTFWFGGVMQRRRYVLLALGMLAFGALIEVTQGLMGIGRTADVWDFVADAKGVAVALVLIYTGLGSWMRHVERALGLSRESA